MVVVDATAHTRHSKLVLFGATTHWSCQGLRAKWQFLAMTVNPAVRGAQDTVTTLHLLRRDGASFMLPLTTSRESRPPAHAGLSPSLASRNEFDFLTM